MKPHQFVIEELRRIQREIDNDAPAERGAGCKPDGGPAAQTDPIWIGVDVASGKDWTVEIPSAGAPLQPVVHRQYKKL